MSKINIAGRKLLKAISAVFLAEISPRRFPPYGRNLGFSLLTIHY